jgi:hypothetical protein
MAVMFITRPRSNMMYWLKSDSLALQAVPEWSQPSFAVRSFHSELAVTLALNKEIRLEDILQAEFRILI